MDMDCEKIKQYLIDRQEALRIRRECIETQNEIKKGQLKNKKSCLLDFHDE